MVTGNAVTDRFKTSFLSQGRENLGSLTRNWSNIGNGKALSQKFLGKVAPDAPVKNKIDYAQKKLEFQVEKLSTISEKLQKKHQQVFQKIVEAQKNNNQSYARAYAVELAEIKKMNNMVSNAKLAMEQIQIRLNTVSELGDVVVTLSPCMSVIKGLGVSLNGIIPEANSSMGDLSKILGDVLQGSKMGQQDMAAGTMQNNADTIAILEEAQAVIEGETKMNIPEAPTEVADNIPSDTPEAILRERSEASI